PRIPYTTLFRSRCHSRWLRPQWASDAQSAARSVAKGRNSAAPAARLSKSNIAESSAKSTVTLGQHRPCPEPQRLREITAFRTSLWAKRLAGRLEIYGRLMSELPIHHQPYWRSIRERRS